MTFDHAVTGIADEEAPDGTRGDRDLHAQGNGATGVRPDFGELSHGRLHRQGGSGGAAAIVAVQPAGDRVTAEADHAATIPVQFSDQRVVDPIQVIGEFFGAPSGAQLAGPGPRSES